MSYKNLHRNLDRPYTAIGTLSQLFYPEDTCGSKFMTEYMSVDHSVCMYN